MVLAKTPDLDALFERTRATDPWDALGVPRGASAEQIRASYFAAMSELTPLRQSEALSSAERDRVVQIVLRLDDAHHGLLARLRGAVQPAALIEQDSPTGASTAIRLKTDHPDALTRGIDAFRAGATAVARARFAEVVMTRPELPDGHFWFARATLALAASPATVDRKTVEAALRRAIELRPHHVEYLLTFARYWRHVGERHEAVRWYARARTLVPEHREAELEMRRLAEPESEADPAPKRRPVYRTS